MLLPLLFALALSAASASDGKTQMKLLRGSCPMFWFSFNDRCYKYFASRMTWGEAEIHCVSEGGNLVPIHSLEEHNFVNYLIQNFDANQGYTWIGLTDIHKEGSWIWSEGSKHEFSNWNDGQPNNANEIEHCGHTNHGINHLWNDEDCSAKLPFVCIARNVCP
ncbi:lactose-binding lectin l-2 [Fundulus heteroclitus]|uniref:lactose-binding lectin l-2 n=1 Tax=Fundulus heteroclitus TaxID=8078 RepID=UPI00165B43AD|nr:lactose-binding lectin l-2 [Fundulus heteroclitus]